MDPNGRQKNPLLCKRVLVNAHKKFHWNPITNVPAFLGTVSSTWALPLTDVACTSGATKWPCHLSCLLACASGLCWSSNLYALIPKPGGVPRLRASSARRKHKCSDRPSWPVTPLVKHFRVPLTVKRGRCLSYLWYTAHRHLSGRASGSGEHQWFGGCSAK